MNKNALWVVAMLTAMLAVCAAGGPANDLIVHEWGTFLSMSGSDGVSLDGMYHEEHALPAFVHSRSKDQLRLPTAITKGETPVIYFYTQTRKQVNVSVGFPSGVWTQWYPQASLVGPSLATTHDPLSLKDGRIHWNVEVLPAAMGLSLPETPKDSLWNHAREVDAAFVRVNQVPRVGRQGQKAAFENERFIFYRGLGSADLPLQFSASAGGEISCSASTPSTLRHLFVLRVEDGRGVFRYIPSLEPGRRIESVIPSMGAAEPMEAFSRKAGHALAARLTESGLFEKEARAMVNTWRTSYLETDGIRVLYVLPQAWTDSFIPMKVDPKPTSLVRVMVGRTELLSPERERAAESAVASLTASDSEKRWAAFDYLRAQGRYVEPILRRTLLTSKDEATRATCRRLLQTEFVTELRSALNDAVTGGPTLHEPVYARARLAQLLRDIGLGPEAKAEGHAVLSELSRMQAPPLDRHDARHYLRASARAYEGIGDDSAALNWYGKFVKFGSQSAQCGGCHALEGPRDMSFYRDWWAGARYAKYARKTNQAVHLTAAHERTLAARPADVEPRLALAYLYAANGNRAAAERMWTALEGRGRKMAGK